MEEILYTIIAAIAFLIPGFITTTIVKKIIPIVNKEYKYNILENFIYSFLNIFIWAIPIHNIYLNIDSFKQNFFWLWLLIFIIIFISPIVIALVIVLINKYELFRKLCTYFNITNIDIEPSAWDFKFKQIENEWVIVTLTNDRTIAGFIGKNSFISDNPQERDLYIDEVYEISKSGNWKKRERTDGIWLKSDEIKTIEFYKCKKGDE